MASGSAADIIIRIVLTMVAAALLWLPGLKLIGAALLVYFGVSLLRPESSSEGEVQLLGSLMAAAIGGR